MKKIILSNIFAMIASVSAVAQGGTNSPYSQFGLGVLADQSQGASRGMNGVGLALRQGDVVNTLNPASYSAVDSLTMIIDLGMSGQITHFKENGSSVNAKNACFEYAVGSFRLLRNVGLSVGILPYSNVGYKYNTSNYLTDTNTTVNENFTGEGGLRQVFLGAGWRLAKPLSVGFNAGYLWGNYTRRVNSDNVNNINALSKSYKASVSNYTLQFGAQWQQPLSKTDILTVGATVGIGHSLHADPKCEIINSNSTNQVADTTTFVLSDGLKIPMTYGLGFAWSHRNKLQVAADVTLQNWGSIDYPVYNSVASTYELQSDLLKNRYQVNVGADYVPNPMSYGLLSRVHYRVGAGYTTPYYNINGQDGPKEYSVSAGLGIPIQNKWQSRSCMLNISAQWVHNSADHLVTENTFRVNVGLTFNEKWFAKWKID